MKGEYYEKKFCIPLGIPTEAERVSQATIDSARYQKKGFHVSVYAIVLAIISLIVSLVALFK